MFVSRQEEGCFSAKKDLINSHPGEKKAMGKRKLIGTIFNTYTLVKTNRKSLNRTLSRNCVGTISGMLLGNFTFLPS